MWKSIYPTSEDLWGTQLCEMEKFVRLFSYGLSPKHMAVEINSSISTIYKWKSKLVNLFVKIGCNEIYEIRYAFDGYVETIDFAFYIHKKDKEFVTSLFQEIENPLSH